MNTLIKWLRIISFTIENNLSYIKFISIPAGEKSFIALTRNSITIIEFDSKNLREEIINNLKNLIKKPIERERADYYT